MSSPYREHTPTILVRAPRAPLWRVVWANWRRGLTKRLRLQKARRKILQDMPHLTPSQRHDLARDCVRFNMLEYILMRALQDTMGGKRVGLYLPELAGLLDKQEGDW